MPNVVGNDRIGATVAGEIKDKIIVRIGGQGTMARLYFNRLRQVLQIFDKADDTRGLKLRSHYMLWSKGYGAILASHWEVHEERDLSCQN
jgi:hypothetical protein